MAPLDDSLAVALGLSLFRIAPLLLATPFVGIFSRLLLLFGGAALLGPLFLPGIAQALQTRPLAPICVHEALVGLLLLFGAMLPWAILRAAGRVLDALRVENYREKPISRLCGLLALCLFFGGGGASLIVAALAKSYLVAPIFSPIATGIGLSPGILLALCGRLFALALQLTLPLVGAWLTALLGLGLVARFLRRGARRTFSALTLPSIVELVVLSAGLLVLIAAWQEQLRTLPYLALPAS